MSIETCYILYNTHAGSGRGEAMAKAFADSMGSRVLKLFDITKITDYKSFFEGLTPAPVVLCGGDGTLNRFVNEIDGFSIPNDIYYYATGTGNDFLRDVIGSPSATESICINEYIRDLPVCHVNGKRYRFLNGVGYGIDGYCCQVGDEMREAGKSKINYTSIAIKGLLFHYKPTAATVTVDGVTHHYKKVWIAPTMNGRFYGGGMIAAPAQKRVGEDRRLSLMIFHDTNRLQTLMIFPSIFKGQHIAHTKEVEILEGRDITVEFDRPAPLQIDGETILGVTSYQAFVEG